MKYYRLFFLISFIFLLFSFSVIFPLNLSWAQDIDENETNIYDDGQIFDIEDEGETEIKDSFESYNRFMFKCNDRFYNYVLAPISKIYSLFFPKPVQKNVNNVFDNAKMPIRFLNNVFQGKFRPASTEIGRFVVNSTVGIGGLFDPAKSVLKMEQHNEDFGQTLGHYGVGSGSYIVWPVLGPSNFRDSIGYVVDAAADPLTWTYAEHTEPDELFTGLQAVRFINNYSYNIREKYESITEQALDPYMSIRHAYNQNRKKKIRE